MVQGGIRARLGVGYDRLFGLEDELRRGEVP